MLISLTLLNLLLIDFVIIWVFLDPICVKLMLSESDKSRRYNTPLKLNLFLRFFIFVKYAPYLKFSFFLNKHGFELVYIWLFWIYTYVFFYGRNIENIDIAYYLQIEHKVFWREINKGWYEMNNKKYAYIIDKRQ